MTQRRDAPATGKDAFDCPYCGAYAHQTWHRTELRSVPADAVQRPSSETVILLEQLAFSFQVLAQHGVGTQVTAASGLYASRCSRCDAVALWYDHRLIWPRTGAAPSAHAGLPEAVKDLYEEAAAIADDSPRGAAAVLRLAADTLCRALVPNKKSLNDCIAELVERGLDDETRQGLDAVRVLGNRAVHTQAWAVSDDDARTVADLFRVVNRIAETLADRPGEVERLYRNLPSEERAKIEKRDRKARRRPA